MEPADHIRVYRADKDYWHHGIYIGVGRVIHFTGGKKTKEHAVVADTSLDDFMLEGKVEIVPYQEGECLPPDVVIERAKQDVGKGKGKYDLLGRNCEHLVTWWKAGRMRSKQVAEKEPLLGALVFGASIVSGIFLGPWWAIAIRALGGMAFLGSVISEGEGHGPF